MAGENRIKIVTKGKRLRMTYTRNIRYTQLLVHALLVKMIKKLDAGWTPFFIYKYSVYDKHQHKLKYRFSFNDSSFKYNFVTFLANL